MSLFVIDPRIHVLLRFIAVFFIGPILLYKGYRVYNDRLLMLLGLGTILVDSYTLYKSIIHIKLFK